MNEYLIASDFLSNLSFFFALFFARSSPTISIDPNIPETGEQLAKSNNGPDTCCYEYCDPFSVYSGICAHCEKDDIQSNLLPQIDHQHIFEPETNENKVSFIHSIHFRATK